MGYWSTNSPTSPRTAYLGFSNPSPVVYDMWSSASVVTVSNTATETALLTGAVSLGSLTIPANYLIAGSQLRIVLRGYIQTAAAVPTVTLKVLLGAVTIYTTGAQSLATGQIVTPAGCEVGLEMGVRTIGATGSISCNGVLWTSSSLAVGISPSTDQVGTVDTTVAETLSVTFKWGTADPANVFSLSSAVVEIMG